MNLKEGTRRLALLLGGVGTIVGGFASYTELQTVLDQRTGHNTFEQLSNSNVVQQERKCRLLGYAGGCSQLPPLPKGVTLLPPLPKGATLNDPYAAYGGSLMPPPPATQTQLDWSKSIPLPSDVNKGGIETINWSHDYGITSIETTDGETLSSPAPAPSAWQYLLIALLPVFGFFIPWGAVRAIGWVGAGFTS